MEVWSCLDFPDALDGRVIVLAVVVTVAVADVISPPSVPPPLALWRHLSDLFFVQVVCV